MPTPPPPVPDQLVEWLSDEIFRDRLPTKDISSFELGRLVGQQDVVRKLRKVNSDQARNFVEP